MAVYGRAQITELKVKTDGKNDHLVSNGSAHEAICSILTMNRMRLILLH